LTCKYVRCASPSIQRGLEYYCGHCLDRSYYSIRCQQKDWKTGVTWKTPGGRAVCAHPLF
ncbi:unnamed protein product, partial [Rhizoctonia solani]